MEDAAVDAEKARRRMGSLVHGVALRDCSDVDRTYLREYLREHAAMLLLM